MMARSMWWRTDGPKSNRKFIGDAEAFMEALKVPGDPSGFFLTDIHRFMGDARDPFLRPQDHILCHSIKAEFICEEQLDVTLVNSDVTCKECLELIHA